MSLHKTEAMRPNSRETEIFCCSLLTRVWNVDRQNMHNKKIEAVLDKVKHYFGSLFEMDTRGKPLMIIPDHPETGKSY